MKKMLILVAVLSIALALGCGGEGEEKVAEKSVGQQTGSSEQEKNLRAVGKPIDISDDSFQTEVLESNVIVLVDFWAPWCKPCLTAAPVLESIAEEYKEALKVCKLNVDQERKIAMEYGIRSIPTLIFYKDGQVVDRVVGVRPNYEAELKKKIESHL